MFISVIIPTYNRDKVLKTTLDSMPKQTLSKNKFEVLVIDNGSTDNTALVVKQYQNKLPNLKYLMEKNPGLHNGRHRGWKEAKGDILIFADDDIEAIPTWLEGIAESFKDNNVALVGGNNLPKFETKPPKWLNDLWEKQPKGKRSIGSLSLIDHGNKVQEIDAYGVFGCNFAIRKSVLVACHGFHPDGMPPHLIKYRGDGESYVSKFVKDNDLTTIFNPKASVYHFVSKDRMTYAYFEKRSFIQGISHSYSDTKAKGHLMPIKSLFLDYYNKLLRRYYYRIISGHSPLKRLDDIINREHFKGYLFHQREMRKDPKLFEWVMKKDYL